MGNAVVVALPAGLLVDHVAHNIAPVVVHPSLVQSSLSKRKNVISFP